MANVSAISRNEWMLRGPLRKKGYDWWWHSLTAENAATGEKKPFYVEFFTCNPDYAEDEPVIVWNDPIARNAGKRPSYLMVNVGFWGKDHGQLHRFFSLRHVDIHADPPFSVKADDCYCDETRTYGSVSISEEDAKAHPENHRGLQIRVCGWNEYFVNLSGELQDDFIARSRGLESAG